MADTGEEFGSQTLSGGGKLVFVALESQTPKPKRRVAIPIPDGIRWEAFLEQVAAKLKLAAVGSVLRAELGGEAVTGLDQLQDLDELLVLEGAAPSGELSGRQQQAGAHRVGVADADVSRHLNHQLDRDADSGQKYARRQFWVVRAAQRVLPEWLQQTLPLTTKDLQSSGSLSLADTPRRRRRKPVLDPAMVLALIFAFGMGALLLLAYSRFAAEQAGRGMLIDTTFETI